MATAGGGQQRNLAVARPTFRKHERLRGRVRIQELVTTGRSVHEPPFKLIGKAMSLPTVAPMQVAFAVPRRHLKLAVHRNRVKRLMREAWRLDKERWYVPLRERGVQVACLIVCQGAVKLTLAEVRMKISRAMDRWLERHG
ncbi:MAG: ribonuclease P protein component [Flavobacteriales bacterium]|nr:ribonuclease P protein component [Flavobacteriales bacterium]